MMVVSELLETFEMSVDDEEAVAESEDVKGCEGSSPKSKPLRPSVSANAVALTTTAGAGAASPGSFQDAEIWEDPEREWVEFPWLVLLFSFDCDDFQDEESVLPFQELELRPSLSRQDVLCSNGSDSFSLSRFGPSGIPFVSRS